MSLDTDPSETDGRERHIRDTQPRHPAVSWVTWRAALDTTWTCKRSLPAKELPQSAARGCVLLLCPGHVEKQESCSTDKQTRALERYVGLTPRNPPDGVLGSSPKGNSKGKLPQGFMNREAIDLSHILPLAPAVGEGKTNITHKHMIHDQKVRLKKRLVSACGLFFPKPWAIAGQQDTGDRNQCVKERCQVSEPESDCYPRSAVPIVAQTRCSEPKRMRLVHILCNLTMSFNTAPSWKPLFIGSSCHLGSLALVHLASLSSNKSGAPSKKTRAKRERKQCS